MLLFLVELSVAFKTFSGHWDLSLCCQGSFLMDTRISAQLLQFPATLLLHRDKHPLSAPFDKLEGFSFS